MLPGAGQPVDHPTISGLRRLHLPRVHYYLYYVVSKADAVLEVVALWHVRRGRPPIL
jgi:plasmid stabilization system protein ParE